MSAKIFPTITDIADRQVPSGVFKVWGNELGWPDWIFDGSSLRADRAIPSRISITDDLTILANFLDNVGPEALLTSLTSKKRLHGTPKSLSRLRSAPHAEAALRLEGRAQELVNRYLTIVFLTNSKQLEITISVNREFDFFGEFLEHAFAMHLLHVARLFSPILSVEWTESKPVLWSRGGQSSWRQVFVEMENCEIHANSPTTRLCLPSAWIHAENESPDPIIWSDAQKWLENLQVSTGSSLSTSRLKGTIQLMIEREQRVPRLKEVAAEEEISERTLARRIASLGITYQHLIDEVRADLATKMLHDGEHSIHFISHALGFSHSASFARAFRQWFGCAPTEWKPCIGPIEYPLN